MEFVASTDFPAPHSLIQPGHIRIPWGKDAEIVELYEKTRKTLAKDMIPTFETSQYFAGPYATRAALDSGKPLRVGKSVFSDRKPETIGKGKLRFDGWGNWTRRI